MNNAIEIVKGMIAKIDAELDAVQNNYKSTRPDSIYDASYRKMLEQMHDRLIVKTIALKDVVGELEKAEDADKGLVDKGV